jgi:hypothetical protein
MSAALTLESNGVNFVRDSNIGGGIGGGLIFMIQQCHEIRLFPSVC